ncbi:MAG: helix-turn-helix transcriptional regulator [Bacteroidetes bacterium]|nr:helix-turn-helix transcriptional regulator [Bacteroidota bacterium]
MNIHIKNMVCNRCIMVVSQIFDEAGIKVENVQLGKVKTTEEVDADRLEQMNNELKSAGFEIINDSKSRIIEKIKNITVDYVYHHTGETKVNFSEYLADRLNLDYPYLSTLYSSVEGTTIEKHLIHLKIERVKELLVYDEKTLSEIAWELGYNSVAYLSGQFKKITGFTPSYFKKIKEQKRKSINDV